MTNAQIAERKSFYRRLRNLSDGDFNQVIKFVDTLEEHEPNEETIAAFMENVDSLPSYKSIEEMFESLDIDVKR